MTKENLQKYENKLLEILAICNELVSSRDHILSISGMEDPDGEGDDYHFVVENESSFFEGEVISSLLTLCISYGYLCYIVTKKNDNLNQEGILIWIEMSDRIHPAPWLKPLH